MTRDQLGHDTDQILHLAIVARRSYFRVVEWRSAGRGRAAAFHVASGSRGFARERVAVGATGGAWAARPSRLAWFPPAADIEPCMRFSRTRLADVLHLVAFSVPWRHDRFGRGATMVPLRLISPSRFGDW
jgi:hypothetical protein